MSAILIATTVVVIIIIIAAAVLLMPKSVPANNQPAYDTNIPPFISDSPTSSTPPPVTNYPSSVPPSYPSSVPPSYPSGTVSSPIPTTSSAAPIGSPVVVASTPAPAGTTSLPSISAVSLSNTVLIAPNFIIPNTRYVDGEYYDGIGSLLLGALPVSGLSAAGSTIYPVAKGYTMAYTCGASSGSAGTVYTATNKGGSALALNSNLATMPSGFNNIISSMVVAANAVIYLYTQANFAGTPVKVYGPAYINDFGRIGINDKVQSIKAVRGCGAPLVTLYDNGYYDGLTVSVGRNEVADLRAIGFPLNALSSVRVTGSCAVYLYPGLNYSGTPLVLSGVGPRPSLPNFNDKAQSLRIVLV